MKLYTFAQAPNPRRVHIFIAEKERDGAKLGVDFQHVDIMKRENRQPEFVERIDAMGRIPVLELDDGSHLAESVAICRYLEALQPNPPLFGRTPVEQGRIEMWTRRMELDFMVPVGLVWIHGSPLTRAVMKNQIPAVAEQNRERVRRTFDFLDTELAGRPHLAGDDFSMADIVGICTLDFAAELNDLRHDPAGHANLERWTQTVKARPSLAA